MRPLEDILDQATRQLEQCGRDAPRLCAELIAGQVLSLSRLDILLGRRRPVSRSERRRIEAMIERRAAGEPLAYILGRKEFYGRDFEVTPDVLVPRPETESIVDLVKAACPEGGGLTFADIGTGSGILAVSLALELPGSLGVATDISSAALRVARRNLLRYGLQERVALVQTDLTAALPPWSFDVCVANPPYLDRAEIEASEREVRLFEPRIALFGGEDGLKVLDSLLEQLPTVIKPGGRFFLEIGQAQPIRLRQTLDRLSSAWKEVGFWPDLSGNCRVLSGQRV